MILVLEGARPLSWNSMYSGSHWTKRKAYADKVHKLVDEQIRNIDPSMEPFDTRVHITVRAFFKNRPLDPCNITAKVYIDGLHGKVIHDDTMEYVASVTTESHIDKNNPRVEIEIISECEETITPPPSASK